MIPTVATVDAGTSSSSSPAAVLLAEGTASTVAVLSALLSSDPLHLGAVLLLAALYIAGLLVRLRIIQSERVQRTEDKR